MSNYFCQLTMRNNDNTSLFLSGKKQRGAVLVVSLIILLLMTLIGTTGMQATSLEEKMAGNMRDRNLAFQAAESALKAGEVYLGTTAALPAFDCTNGLYPAHGTGCTTANVTSTTAPMPPVWENINWSTQSVLYTGVLADLNTNPRYIIEDMGVGCASPTSPCPAADVRNNYRVTARATGGTADSVVIVQSLLQL